MNLNPPPGGDKPPANPQEAEKRAPPLKPLAFPPITRKEKVPDLNSIFHPKCRLPRRLETGAVLLSLLLLAGCASAPKALTDPIIGPGYEPQNVYRKAPVLPLTMRRVVVLPMTYSEAGSLGAASEDLFEQVILSELNKENKFELIAIRPDELKQWTGKARWAFHEALPPGFFQKLRGETGCDGILFVHLSNYHAYPPMVIGWRMHLLTAEEGDVIWSIDEVFDAGDERVNNSARRYSRQHLQNRPALEDSRSILLAPRRFAQYTAAAAAGTLPMR